MPTELRHAFRALRRAPAFTTAAAIVLGLGIGVTTAIAALCYAVLLRPLPYPQPERLVTVWQDLRLQGGPPDEWASPGNVVDWRDPALFSTSAAITGWSASLTHGGEPELLTGAQVTASYFGTLGARPLYGRDFTADDDVPNAPRVAILSHGLWQRRFGGDPAIVGTSIPIGGAPHTIVGVLPTGVVPVVLTDAEIFRPLRLNTANPSRGAIFLRVVARLADGVTLDTARARAEVKARQLETAHPSTNRDARIAIVPLQERIARESRPALLVLLGAVGLVLLIACANVANLALARTISRSRELAVRAALGASGARLALQQLAESAIASGIAGIGGLLLALWLLQALSALAPAAIALAPDGLGSTARIAAIASVVTIVTALLFGLVPALRSSRPQADGAGLREGARSTHSAGRARRGLVIAEVALAAVLLVGAGLLLRSFLALQSFDRGFNPHGLLVGQIVPDPTAYRERPTLASFYDRLQPRLAAIPGVAVASLSSILPFGGDSDFSFEIEGRTLPSNESQQPVTWYRAISADHLRAMAIPILRGRGLDQKDAAPSVVVNETFSRRYWPQGDALGQRLRPGPDAPWFTIVGVARDTYSRGPTERPVAELFVSYTHIPERGMWMVLRPTVGPGVDPDAAAAALAPALRAALREIDPSMPISSLATLAELMGEDIARPRGLAAVTGLFAGLALLLSAAGVYAVLAYSVAQRTAEIGVRLALGAQISDIFRLVLGEALRLGALGVVVGMAAALVAGRALQAVLFNVSAVDPIAIGSTAALLGVALLAAGYLPARRAARVDPVVAMRE